MHHRQTGFAPSERRVFPRQLFGGVECLHSAKTLQRCFSKLADIFLALVLDGNRAIVVSETHGAGKVVFDLYLPYLLHLGSNTTVVVIVQSKGYFVVPFEWHRTSRKGG